MTEDTKTGGGSGAGGADSAGADSVIIKKYANRRLYNTATSSYVTLDHLSQMVKEGTDFTVRDAKSGEDITHQVLTQIIVEEEAKGHNLLPIGFLRRLIRLYDDSMQAYVPRYLELTMENFSNNQERMRARLDGGFGGIFPVAEFEEMGRQNMAAFQKALNIFSPPGAAEAAAQRPATESTESTNSTQSTKTTDDTAGGGDEISQLKGQMENMQAQLDKLARQSGRTK